MIPPVSSDVLASNPQFASIHKLLTTKYLDPDASTKSINISQGPIEEQANKHLTQLARDSIIAQSLHDLVSYDGAGALPEELRDLVYIVSTYLLTTRTFNKEQTELLALEVEKLNEALPKVSALLSSELLSQHTHLRALSKTSATTSSSTDKLSRYSLQVQLKDTTSHLQKLQQTTIPSTTITLISTLTQLLSLHTDYLALQLTHLSRYTHGTLSRHTLSRSAHLSTISEALSAKTRIFALEGRRATYSAQMQHALANYSSHLDALTSQLDSRIRTLEDELRLYERCDGREGKTMEELGKRYGEVLREIEVVKGDVERLHGEREGESGGGRKASKTTFEVP